MAELSVCAVFYSRITMIHVLKQITTETVSENPYWRYCRDTYMLPNGKTGDYHYVHTPGSVFIIPRFKNGTFLLVKQYRYLNRRISLEFPGGGIKIAIGAEASAHNELAEEAGLKANSIHMLGSFNPCNGITDELCTVFLAEDFSKISVVHDESEEFEYLSVSEEEFGKLIADGQIWDGMTLAAWSLYKNSDQSFNRKTL